MQLLHMDMVNNVILLSLQTIFLINPNYSATHNINAHGLLVLALLMRAVWIHPLLSYLYAWQKMKFKFFFFIPFITSDARIINKAKKDCEQNPNEQDSRTARQTWSE